MRPDQCWSFLFVTKWLTKNTRGIAYVHRIAMDHFKNPRNVGEIPDADGIGEVGNPPCGDIMAFYVKVKDDVLEDVKFKTLDAARHRGIEHGQ